MRKISATVGNVYGVAKTERGGFKAVDQKPIEVCVWKKAYGDGNIHFFKGKDEYTVLRGNVKTESTRFVLAVQQKALNKEDPLRLIFMVATALCVL